MGFLGDSAKFAGKKYPPLAGAFMMYNEARANGNSHVQACTIAGLEEVNPLPIGYSEFRAAGEAYGDAMDWAIENNSRWNGGRGIPVDKQGFSMFLRRNW